MKKMKNRWKQKIYSMVLVLMLMLTGSMTVQAADGAKMVLQFDSNSYEAGSVAKAQVYIYDAEFNAAGFSLKYDTARMKPVLPDGSDSDNGNQLITISNQYDDEEGTGVFMPLTREVDKEKGQMSSVFFVSPNVGKSTVAGSEGMLVGEVSFYMLEAGKPDAVFAADEDSVDFYGVPCLIMNGGAQMEIAKGDVVAGEETIQEVDVSKSVLDEADAKLAEEKAAGQKNEASGDAQKENPSGNTSDADKANADGTDTKNGTNADGTDTKNGTSADGTDTKNGTNANGTDAKDGTKDGVKESKGTGWHWGYTVGIVLAAVVVIGVVLLVIRKKKQRGEA